MSAKAGLATSARSARQHGFSLLELLIAMALAVFLLAGLFTIVQGTRRTSTDQSGLAQLQDNERVALSVMTDVVQTAGYFPGAPTTDLATELPANSTFATAGQSVVGAANGTKGYSITVRYETAGNDRVSSCLGNTNTVAGSTQIYVNTFSVNAQNQLTCGDGVTAPVALVNGVTFLDVRYAVNTSATAANSNCPADRFLTTAQINGSTSPGPAPTLLWSNVCAIRVILTFTNPLYQPIPGGPTTPGQQPTVTISRLISIMNKSGVNSVTTTS